MNFLHPERLWLLVVAVGLLLGYLELQRRRRAAIERYTNPAMLPSIAPQSLGWRRHLPTAAAMIGLVAIVLAIAQPTRAEHVPRNEGVVIVAVDVSASMIATDVEPSRLRAAINGALEFANSVPDGIELGLVAFDGGARLLVSPTTDRNSILNAIEGLQTGPGTAAGEAIFTSLDAIKAALTPSATSRAGSGGHVPAAIVLLSDGVTNQGRSPEEAARAAGDAGVPVSTIAFGTPSGTVTIDRQRIPVPADNEAMKAIADLSGGQFFTAESAGQLRNVYDDIRLQVAFTTQQREITRALLAGALVALVLATALAMGLTSRSL